MQGQLASGDTLISVPNAPAYAGGYCPSCSAGSSYANQMPAAASVSKPAATLPAPVESKPVPSLPTTQVLPMPNALPFAANQGYYPGYANPGYQGNYGYAPVAPASYGSGMMPYGRPMGYGPQGY